MPTEGSRGRILLAVLLMVAGRPALAQRPSLRFVKTIGDMRGRGMDNLSVAVTDDGRAHLLMRSGRVAVFGPGGEYRESRQVALAWPQDQYALAAAGRRVFVGNTPDDFPWVFSLRRTGEAPGRFRQPRGAAVDDHGTVFVADTGNRRVQVFAPGRTEAPAHVLALPAAPVAVGVRGAALAVLTEDGKARLYRVSPAGLAEEGAWPVGPAGRAVAIGPGGDLFVAYGPPDHRLCRFQREGGGLAPAATPAPSFREQWPAFFPAGVPMALGPDGEVWFATDLYGSLLSVNPATDVVRERVRGLHRPLAVAFDRAGKVWVTGYPRHGEAGPRILTGAVDGTAPAASFPSDAPFCRADIPFWGLLPDADGSVLIRVVEEGYEKGWPALALKRISPDGRIAPFLDFGPLYAKRRTFHPAEMAYSLRFDAQGDIVLAALPLVSVLKATPGGKVLWEAGTHPQGGADVVPFLAPRDVAVDSRGNLWVVDAGGDQIFCLSSQGKLLLTYGSHANVDDREGRGFDRPTGVAVASSAGREYLYVGDAGNQRLVKFEMTY